MFYRVKQFFKGLFAWAYNNDNIDIDRVLKNRERELFDKLPVHERRHAIDTAAMIMKDGGSDLLIKAGLLHDIGKISGTIGIVKKSILVLMDKFLPSLSKKLSGEINMFNIYYHHPEIGADMLREIGTEEIVIKLVRYHHSEKECNIDGLKELKKADSSN